VEAQVLRQAINAFFHAGKFQDLLELVDVTDVMINRFDWIVVQYVDGHREMYPHPVFTSDDDLRGEVSLLGRNLVRTERRFDAAKPYLTLRLPDGSRLAALSHVTGHTVVAIRLVVVTNPTLDELVERRMIDSGMRSFFQAAIAAGMRIVTVGETGAGKTTLMKALLNTLPVDTRLVVIEDTSELGMGRDPERAPYVLECEVREDNVEQRGEVTIATILKVLLRFNPDWLIVGEVRDGDAAREMLLAMQHGHPSLSTVHHATAAGAWTKLAQYLGRGADAMGFDIAGMLIADAVDFFVHLGRDRDGNRVVTEIVETDGWNPGSGVAQNRIWEPDTHGRGVPRPTLTDARRRRLEAHGFDAGVLLNPLGWWQQ